MFRNLVTPVVAALTFSVCVACCPSVNAPPILRNSAEAVKDRSVAIIEKGHAVCGGVWVAPDRVLTALHCVSDAGNPDADSEESPLVPWDPKQQPIRYTDAIGAASKPVVSYPGIVLRYDRKKDLALLATVSGVMPKHDVAPVAKGAVRDGAEVDVVGSPLGLAFTYIRGYVSATREGDDEKPFRWLQLSLAGVNHGSSGGGAFINGELVGIADFMHAGLLGPAPSIAFYVHRDDIRDFLAE